MFAIDQTKTDKRPENLDGGIFLLALTGLRYYSPRLGRWISRDPLSEDSFALISGRDYLMISAAALAGAKRYADVGFLDNRSINTFDFLGLFPGVGRWYGSWCGSGYSDGRLNSERASNPLPPLNWNGPVTCPIDAACRDHDACYEMCSTGTNPPTGATRPSEGDCIADCNHQLVETLEEMGPPDEDCGGISLGRRFRVYQEVLGWFR